MRKTLHIFLEPSTAFETYWRECWFDSDFADYDVNLIGSEEIVHESALYSDTYHKSSQLKMMMNVLDAGKFKSGDICIFVNAWNFVAIPLNYFRLEYGLDIKMIGIWGDNTYARNAAMYGRMTNKGKHSTNWVEATLCRIYDRNCFFTEAQHKAFKIRLRGIDTLQNSSVTGYPFEYLARTAHTKPTKRLDVVILPYILREDQQSTLLKLLSRDMPELKFVYPLKTHNDRSKYRNLLGTAKAMLTGHRIKMNPVMLWEGMLNGVVPMIPDKDTYNDFFPKRYQYLNHLIPEKAKPMLNIIRHRLQLHQTIQEVIENYKTTRPQLLEDANVILDAYYRNAPFLEILKSC